MSYEAGACAYQHSSNATLMGGDRFSSAIRYVQCEEETIDRDLGEQKTNQVAFRTKIPCHAGVLVVMALSLKSMEYFYYGQHNQHVPLYLPHTDIAAENESCASLQSTTGVKSA